MTLCNSIAGEALMVTCEQSAKKISGEVSSLIQTFAISPCRSFAIKKSLPFSIELNSVRVRSSIKCIGDSPFNLFSREDSWRFSLPPYGGEIDANSDANTSAYSVVNKYVDMPNKSKERYFNINIASNSSFLIQSYLHNVNPVISAFKLIKKNSRRKNTQLLASTNFTKQKKFCFVGKLLLKNGLTHAQRAESLIYQELISPGELSQSLEKSTKSNVVKRESNSYLAEYAASRTSQIHQQNDKHIALAMQGTHRTSLFSLNAMRQILTACERNLPEDREKYNLLDSSVILYEKWFENNRQLLSLALKVKKIRRSSLLMNSNCSISKAKLADGMISKSRQMAKNAKSVRGNLPSQNNEHTNDTHYVNEGAPGRWRKNVTHSDLLTLSKGFSLGNKNSVLKALRQSNLFDRNRRRQASVSAAQGTAGNVKEMTQVISNSQFVKKANIAMRDLLLYQQSPIRGDHRHNHVFNRGQNMIEQHAAAPLVKELKQRFVELQKNNSNDTKALLQAVQSLTESMNQAVSKQAMARHSAVRPLNFLGPL